MADAVAEQGSAGLRPGVEHLAHRARAILRGRDAAALSAALDLDLPREAYGSVRGAGRAALWLGPDEWLLLDADADDTGLLARGLVGETCSLVDVSHRQIAFGVEGAQGEVWLASGCPLDLGRRAFPVGAVTRTLFHKAEIILWRTAEERFEIEVWRSFAPYVEALLLDAVRIDSP